MLTFVHRTGRRAAAVILGAGFGLMALPALADNCDPMPSGFDGVYCFGKIYHTLDAELNDAYGDLRGKLTTAEKRILRDAQRSWIDARNRNCMPDPHTVNLNCAIDTTKSRTRALRDMTAACTAVGCPTSKLSEY